MDTKKVLMLCEIRDIRSMKYAKYLRADGYQPAIMTIKNPSLFHKNDPGDKPEDIEVFEAWNIFPFLEIARGALRRINMNPQLLDLPDKYLGWIPHAVLASARIIKRHNIRLLYVSSPPYSFALAGVILKKITKTPLVLDLRDPWTFNEYSHSPSFIHLALNKIMERRALSAADRVIVVSETMKSNYISAYPWSKDRIEVIPNGYDFDGPAMGDACLPGTLTISYIGTIYGQNKFEYFDRFFKSVRNLVYGHGITDIRVYLVGSKRREIEHIIDNNGLNNYVICTPMLTHDEAIDHMYRSDVLLQLEPSTAMTRKAHEYLATGKPILAVIRDGEQKMLIREYSDCAFIATSADTSDIEKALAEVYEQWRAGGLKNTSDGKLNDYRALYHRKHLTQRLAHIFNQVIQQ